MIAKAIACVTVAAFLALVGMTTSTADSTPNACVTCHQRPETMRALPAPSQDAVIHWYGSVHGRAGVSCDQCHGGDSEAPSKRQAHKGVQPSSDPNSPIYYQNVPKTCGTCHSAVYDQFVQSEHYQNLKADRLAPTCTTCHGFQMDIHGVKLPHIVERCKICHRPKGVAPQISNAAERVVQEVIQTKEAIEEAETTAALLTSLKEASEVEAISARVDQAQKRFEQTETMWHTFELYTFSQEMLAIRTVAIRASTAAKRLLEGKAETLPSDPRDGLLHGE